VTDEENRKDKETERENAPAEEGGEAEAEGGKRGDREPAGEKLREKDAGDGAQEDAEAGLSRLGGAHGRKNSKSEIRISEGSSVSSGSGAARSIQI
jgi:hypothetical protein